MNLSTNEKKLRHLETFKRLINLGLTTVCLGLEIAIFAYWWQMQIYRSSCSIWFIMRHMSE